MFKGTDWPAGTERLFDIEMPPSMTTRMVALAVGEPGALARIPAVPNCAPVTVNVPVVLPAGIVTLVVLKLTEPAGLAERVTVVPLGCGAAELSVIVPPRVWVSPTPPALFWKEMEIDGAAATTNVQLVAVFPAESFTWILKLPLTVGVPVMAPVEGFSVSPLGRVPTTAYV
jgi:hypothetical protein